MTEQSTGEPEEPTPQWVYRVVLSDGTVEYEGGDESQALALMQAFAGAMLTRYDTSSSSGGEGG